MMEVMKPINPLSDFWKSPKDGHKLTLIEATSFFIVEFLKDLNNGAFAVDEKHNKIQLGEEGAEHHNVDKVGGKWCIQKKLPHKITRVRDRDFILIKKLDRQENTLFEFYKAKIIGYNCYGAFVINCPENDYIVAKYDTDKETYWGYGKTLEDARAYLGLKLFDEYKDVIHTIACKNIKTKTENKF